jgi:microcystin-dependent protein
VTVVDTNRVAASEVRSTEAVVAPTGGGEAFSVVGPVLVLTWCIALEGVYPN